MKEITFNVNGHIFSVTEDNNEEFNYTVSYKSWFAKYRAMSNAHKDVLLSGLNDCPLIDKETANFDEEKIVLAEANP